MKHISFDGVGAVVATFEAAAGVAGGQVVKLTGNGTVGPCEAGDAFAGVALEPWGGMAAVQVTGLCAVSGTGLPVGRALLAADGNGGVKAAAPGSAGAEVLVVSVEEDGTAVICL